MNDSPDKHEDNITNTTVGEGHKEEGADVAAAVPASIETGEQKETTVEPGPNKEEEATANASVPEKAGTEPPTIIEGEAGSGDVQTIIDQAENTGDAGGDKTEQDGPAGEVKAEEGNGSAGQPADASANVSAEPSPAVSHMALHPDSSSRTSTPPLAANAPAKKFSAINVNKKFLSKTGTSPSPSAVGPAAKLNPLAGRPISSPVPIAAPSSRLLSTKLTTVSSTKPSVSPQPPSSASSSSPWARTSLPTSDSSMTGLHQPLPSKKGGLVGMTAPMGQGQGIAASRPAWRAVNADGKRLVGGMSRDFPTASEVAQGKKTAAYNAQAQAAQAEAQAEALLKGLNLFTHLEPNAHRWDDDDDDDEVIDFGDGGAPTTTTSSLAPPRPAAPTDQPVGKSERFVEDFDRSWPRSAAQAAEEERQRAPELRKRESDRVLFNASSNRLEPPSSRPAPPPQPPQPTRLMSRSDAPPADRNAAGGASAQRQLPPHLAGTPSSGRPLPPHMSGQQERPSPSAQPAPAQQPARAAWGPSRDAERQLPPHMATRPELPPQSSAFDKRSPSTHMSSLPPRKSFSQTTAPPPPPPAPEAASSAPRPPPAADVTDTQAAEMHSAAEKARLRRQAEEDERQAAADRAKQKAKELEARFGAKPSPAAAAAAETKPAPAALAAAPSYTIAQRPKAQPEATNATTSTGPPKHAPTGPSRLPSRPSVGEGSRPQDDQWRSRAPPAPATTAPTPQLATREQEPQGRQTGNKVRQARPTAETFFERRNEAEPAAAAVQSDKGKEKAQAGPSMDGPDIQLLQRAVEAQEGSGKSDTQFDDMLARIKAAMGPSHPEGEDTETSASAARSPPARRQKAAQPAKAPKAPVAAPASEAPSAPAPPPEPPRPRDIFFDVVELDIPRSPPPAWRSYAVKLPKSSKPVPEISSARLSAISRSNPPPRGWLMSFRPPVELNPKTLSLPEALLPSPAPRRFFNKTEGLPLVNISQQTYEPFVKKARSGSTSAPAQHATNAQAPPAQNRNAKASFPAQTRASNDRWRVPEETRTVVPEPIATQTVENLLEPPPRKAKSPMKPSATSRPGSAAKFEGIAIGMSDSESVEPDMKSGVRFMVSSELEGDSLLDEVNKMSLDTVEETETGAAAAVPGAEAPASPKNTGTASSRLPESPSAATQWNQQHDHLKNVWDKSAQASTPSPALGMDSTANPMYPNVNGATPVDGTAGQPLSYSSQAFSPGSAAFPMRASPAINGMQSQTSSDNLTTLSYGSTPKPQPGAVNGYPSNGYTGMTQHGLWSAPNYGPSAASPVYGYGAKSGANPLDQKTAMAFNTASGSKDMQGQYAYSSVPSPHYARSPYGPFSPGYATQQQLQQQQRMASSPNGNYGYAAYNPNPSPVANGARGRFAHPQANGGAGTEYVGGYAEGQYYGSVGGRAGHALPSQSQAMYYTSGGAGSIGQGQGQGQQVQGSSNGHAMQGQGQGSRRKMW